MRNRYQITPIGKPRMTARDKWKQRPPVMRYRAFCDEVRLHDIRVPPSDSHIIFIIPMPKSWSQKKRNLMDGQPHQQKPDIDNLTKSLLDALFDDDAHIWDVRTSKIWGETGQIIIEDAQ
ncbi:RusA family crossover junction endodeoxyribonuclease [Scandinavium goeteborgense]|uniref:RusA family crossover junction endodeoxyribonuclease n=1 Tax=Scandinavium goeteborgense TaxID=1851514 RepID=UPI00216617B3|nr:RusA family crossover junction endodeoxyribonuclease [Scandinavium goeteborgense]MCS2154727.1 RusA family crossover junction endodeoxyribonuclease [Scandinavium goeteborgense]